MVLYPESCHVLDPDRAESERHGVQGGGACPAAAKRKRGRTFCRPGTKYFEHYECRGTSLIGAANLSPGTKLIAGTGAVSRYKLSRSQKLVTVQDYNCGQVRVSGCNSHYELVLGAGAKVEELVTKPRFGGAKSVTNNLPILTVLYVGLVLKLS